MEIIFFIFSVLYALDALGGSSSGNNENEEKKIQKSTFQNYSSGYDSGRGVKWNRIDKWEVKNH
jgi:hypothetical protein